MTLRTTEQMWDLSRTKYVILLDDHLASDADSFDADDLDVRAGADGAAAAAAADADDVDEDDEVVGTAVLHVLAPSSCLAPSSSL